MRVPVAAFLSAFTAVSTASAQLSASAAQSGGIPNQVRRRIAQAMWPENLFDSTGTPEPGFVRRPFQPAYADLRLRRAPPLTVLHGVVLYVGSARASRCDHCGTRTYAVAQRGTAFVTLLGSGDLESLARWVRPDVLTDTTRLRDFLLDALRATCLINCDLTQIHRRMDVPQADSRFLRASDGKSSSWHMPRTYAWQRNGGALVELALLARGDGVYAARAEADGRGRLDVTVSPVAHYMFH